jgi:vacuolar protein sorting-associated protein 11
VGTNLHAYGKTFLAEWPDETTELFITYYTGKYVPSNPDTVEKLTSPPPSISGALSSFRDAADNVTKYVQYLPYISDKPRSSSSSAKNAPSVPPQQSTSNGTNGVAPPNRKAATPVVPSYQPPRPRAAFSIFVDFSGCFVRFLEALMEDGTFAERDGKDVDDVCTTLFEAYLREAKNGKKEEQIMWEDKAKVLLTDRSVPPHHPFSLILWDIINWVSYPSTHPSLYRTWPPSTKERG